MGDKKQRPNAPSISERHREMGGKARNAGCRMTQFDRGMGGKARSCDLP